MRSNRHSYTALRVAMRRAAHQLYDDPRVLDDPLALPILGPGMAARLQTEGDRAEKIALVRGMRAFMAVRSRYAEDVLARAVATQGVRQYVVLGAGLDTFAYRNPHAGLRVFEVDHPATQAWKRELLAAAGIPIPDSVTFAPVDFETGTLAEGLAAAGFRRDAPTVFAWLGVVPYLTHDAVMATLRFVASLPAPGSAVVFDYATSPSALNWRERWLFRLIAARVAAAGEPWRTFFEPAELAQELRSVGFGEIEDLGSGELNERYFTGRADGLYLQGRFGRLVQAQVEGRAPGIRV